MHLLLPLILPTILFQLLTGRRPLLVLTPIASVLLLAGLSAQGLAAYTSGFDGVLVRIAFVCGLSAIALLFRASGSAISAWLATGGAAMNALPVLVYGAMPVGANAVLTASGSMSGSEASLTAPKHVIVDSLNSSIALFCDVIPVPNLNLVVSVGDLFVVVAFLILAAQRVTRSKPETVGLATFA